MRLTFSLAYPRCYFWDMAEEEQVRKRIGARVVDARTKAGLSQAGLAERIDRRLRAAGAGHGMSRSALSQIENGATWPAARSMAAMAEELGADLILDFAPAGVEMIPALASVAELVRLADDLPDERRELLIRLGHLLKRDERAVGMLSSMLNYLDNDPSSPVAVGAEP